MERPYRVIDVCEQLDSVDDSPLVDGNEIARYTLL